MSGLQPFPTITSSDPKALMDAINQIARIRKQDIAINNNLQVASSAAQGYVPATSGNAAEFLNGANPPVFSLVTDANLSVSDTTTNNVSTAAHGFAPKAPNDITQFLRGDAAFAAATHFKAGSFSYDLTTATAHQAITGVGFKPKAVLLFETVNTTAPFSLGFSDGTANASFQILSGVSVVNTTIAVVAFKDASNFQTALINSFDTDGFTLAWTKTASPTGTATIIYLALA